MKRLEEILKRKNMMIIICMIILLMLIGTILFIQQGQNNEESIEILDETEQKIKENSQINNTLQENDKNLKENNIEEGKTEEQEKEIAIHIIGEVKKTGIIYLKEGARVADAIKAAGGATKNANLDNVNLAYLLEDGEKIYIPHKKEKVEQDAYIITNNGKNALVKKENNIATDKNTKGGNKKVDINSANQTELETLPGIGPSLAQRIIEYREVNGIFKKIEDIQNVKGIGDSKFNKIKDNICV